MGEWSRCTLVIVKTDIGSRSFLGVQELGRGLPICLSWPPSPPTLPSSASVCRKGVELINTEVSKGFQELSRGEEEVGQVSNSNHGVCLADDQTVSQCPRVQLLDLPPLTHTRSLFPLAFSPTLGLVQWPPLGCFTPLPPQLPTLSHPVSPCLVGPWPVPLQVSAATSASVLAR